MASVRASGLTLAAAVVAAVVAGCGGESPIAAGPNPSRLAVEIVGLPPGAGASIMVTGPGDYARVIDASTTLDSLASGTYTLSGPVAVFQDGVHYAPSPATQTVNVPPGGIGVADRITFIIPSGRLAVNVSGLPELTAVAVQITGPDNYAFTLDRSYTLSPLAPGSYTVAAPDVERDGVTYHADPATQTVMVSAGAVIASADIAYGAGTGALDVRLAGLPSGMNAGVIVTGPGGLARAVHASTTLRYLATGTYTVAAAPLGSELTTYTPSAASQSLALTDGETGVATVTYAPEPLQLTLQTVVSGLVNATFATGPPGDSRIFIVERAGRVRTFRNGVLDQLPFADISARVNSTGERGLLSITFDPDYSHNGYIYAYYVGKLGDMVVERWTSTPGGQDAIRDERVVISIAHGGENHHGGTIAFGLDGMLYVAPGDGGCCGDPKNNAQNLTSPLGKILRLNVRTLPYTIPAGNPFIRDQAGLPEIWAWGLRNPWRYSFDAPSGFLYIGDVGQDAHEEVDVVDANAGAFNFGWRLMEGLSCYNPASGCNATGSITLPVLDYPHSDGCSVTAGYVYRGAAIPELTGHFLYADYCRGWLRSFKGSPGSATDRHSWGITLPNTLSFARDGAGELYMLTASTLSKIVRQ